MLKGSIEWEHDPKEGLTIRFKPSFGKAMSSETRSHVRAARKEMLLVIRSLIDAAVERMEKGEKKPGQARARIKVE